MKFVVGCCYFWQTFMAIKSKLKGKKINPDEELKFKIDHPKLKETKKIYTNMNDLRNMMLDNSHNRFKEEKEEENKIVPEGPILNFKVRIGSGYVIYIPNKIFLNGLLIH